MDPTEKDICPDCKKTHVRLKWVEALHRSLCVDCRADWDRGLEIEKAKEAAIAMDQAPIVNGRAYAQPAHAKLFEAIKEPPPSFLPEDDKMRKDAPMFRGLLGYFPAALFEVAAHSLDSDRKHNPGAMDGPTWARGKSADHEDCIVRHLIDAGPKRNSLAFKIWKWAAPKFSTAKDARRFALRCLAWRALALLQEDCEADGALPGVSSRFPEAP